MAAFGIETLKKGLALCGKNFAGFVDAWNHVVRRSANLCGDGDTNPADGLVTVDNSDVDHPVIRLDKSKLPSGSGASGGTSSAIASAFGLVETTDDDGTVTDRQITNMWFNAGGVTKGTGGSVSIGLSTGCVYAEFNLDDLSCIVNVCPSIDSMSQGSISTYVVPLYIIGTDGSIIDLRAAPQIQMFETGLA